MCLSRWSIWRVIYRRMSRVILPNFMHPRGRGGGGEGKLLSPHLAWLRYQVPHINHTSCSHIPAPILLSETLKSIGDEWENRDEGTKYDKGTNQSNNTGCTERAEREFQQCLPIRQNRASSTPTLPISYCMASKKISNISWILKSCVLHS